MQLVRHQSLAETATIRAEARGEPIFVHASPRSGSTYFFNVLRRSESLLCFNEPLSDVFGYWGKRGTETAADRYKWDTNHRFLEQHDFAEIVDAWDSVMHLYPMYYQFQDYLPPGGILPEKLRAYFAALIDFAASRGRRAALCEIFSRGRAGALRGAFAGFHVAQYRDPLSQFGSFYRPLQQAGEWYFLVFPIMELGIAGRHPLYLLVPEEWRVPVLPWPTDDPTQRWASTLEYLAMAASPKADTIEKLFRWHLFAWVLNNLAAICYSDLALDIDKAHDSAEYRKSVVETLAPYTGSKVDLGDIAKFSRYYHFESLDVAKVCDQVAAALTVAVRDGRADQAVRRLGTRPPMVAATAATELLLNKLYASATCMAASSDRTTVSVEDWTATAQRHQRIWFNPYLRSIGQRIYRFGAPILRAARRVRWR